MYTPVRLVDEEKKIMLINLRKECAKKTVRGAGVARKIKTQIREQLYDKPFISNIMTMKFHEIL